MARAGHNAKCAKPRCGVNIKRLIPVPAKPYAYRDCSGGEVARVTAAVFADPFSQCP